MGCNDSKVSAPTSKHSSNQSGVVKEEVTIDLVQKNEKLVYKIIMITFYPRMEGITIIRRLLTTTITTQLQQLILVN